MLFWNHHQESCRQTDLYRKRHRREYAPPSCTHKSPPSEGNDCPTEIQTHFMHYYKKWLNSFKDHIWYQTGLLGFCIPCFWDNILRSTKLDVYNAPWREGTTSYFNCCHTFIQSQKTWIGNQNTAKRSTTTATSLVAFLRFLICSCCTVLNPCVEAWLCWNGKTCTLHIAVRHSRTDL